MRHIRTLFIYVFCLLSFLGTSYIGIKVASIRFPGGVGDNSNSSRSTTGSSLSSSNTGKEGSVAGTGSGRVLAASTGNSILNINVPTIFKTLLTAASLSIEGESNFLGESTFHGDTTFLSNVTLGGSLTLTDDVIGEGSDINLGTGKITAGNIIYTVTAGTGIGVSGSQDLTITNSDLGSSQNIFKKIKLGSDISEADSNTDTFEFLSGSGISLSLNTSDDKLTITNSMIPGFMSSGSYALLSTGLTRVGIGTSTPSNTLELDSGTVDTSGFTFTKLTSSSTAGVGGGKVLSVDSGGKIILVSDQTGDTPTAESVLPSATNGMTLYFNGVSWVASDNLFHDGGSIGVSNNAPTSRFQVNTNLATKIGAIIKGYTSQSANLQEWRNSSDTILSYIDSNGVYNGAANVAGSLNPGFTTGSIPFQGASGLTQDNTNLYWDNTNKRLGVGNANPSALLSVGSSSQFQVNTSGEITIAKGLEGDPTLSFSGDSDTGIYSLGNGRTTFSANGYIAGEFVQISGYHGLSMFQTNSIFLNAGSNYSAANPALGFVGDQNTGFYRPSTDNLGIVSGGIERVRVDQNGNVGIGTTTPTSPLHVSGAYGTNAAMTVNQTGTSGDIFTASASGATKFVISNGGNVGIGTASPGSILDVQGGYLNVSGGATISATYGTGSAFSAVSNSLSTGNILKITSTSTALSTGSLGVFDWSPGSATIATGDLLSLNIGSNGTIGNIFNVKNAGASVFSVSQSQITASLPMQFNSPGDLGVAYNLNFTNPTSAFINSNASLYLQAGEVFNSSDLTLRTFNRGNVITDTQAFVTNYAATISGQLVVGTSVAPANIGGMYLTNPATYGKALAIFNQTEAQDIFTASASGVPKFVVTNGGMVGIGTSSPTVALQVRGAYTVNNTIAIFEHTNPGDAGRFGIELGSGIGAPLKIGTITNHLFQLMANRVVTLTVKPDGNVGIGTTTPTSPLHISGAYGTNAAMTVNQTGVSGDIMTASASGITKLQLSNAGVLRLNAYGAGDVTTDSDGNIVTSSDERLKVVQGSFSRGLSDILKLDPKLYKWNSLSGLETNTTYAGFIAQDVKLAIPEAVGSSPAGYLSLLDRPILAALVNAVKEQEIKINDSTSSALLSLGDRITNLESKVNNTVQNTDTGLISQIVSWTQSTFTFLKDVLIKGRVTTEDRDAGGFAKIAKDMQQVPVAFEKAFQEKPVLTLTAEDYDGLYFVHNATPGGFIIRLQRTAPQDITFHWSATAVLGARVVEGSEQTPVTPSPTPTPTATPTPTPTPEATESASLQ